MAAPVLLDDLISAFDWLASGDAAGVDCEARISRATGQVHWSGEGAEEELPDDFADDDLYVDVPRKSDLDLGRSLALRFVKAHLPASYDTAADAFRSRGAYGRFKSLLEREGQLEAWYRYETAETEKALRAWCEENDLQLQAGA